MELEGRLKNMEAEQLWLRNRIENLEKELAEEKKKFQELLENLAVTSEQKIEKEVMSVQTRVGFPLAENTDQNLSMGKLEASIPEVDIPNASDNRSTTTVPSPSLDLSVQAEALTSDIGSNEVWTTSAKVQQEVISLRDTVGPVSPLQPQIHPDRQSSSLLQVKNTEIKSASLSEDDDSLPSLGEITQNCQFGSTEVLRVMDWARKNDQIRYEHGYSLPKIGNKLEKSVDGFQFLWGTLAGHQRVHPSNTTSRKRKRMIGSSGRSGNSSTDASDYNGFSFYQYDDIKNTSGLPLNLFDDLPKKSETRPRMQNEKLRKKKFVRQM